MQFACEKCGTRYAVPDEKVRGKRIRTKCRRCGSEILVEGPPGPSGPPSNRTTSIPLVAQQGAPASRRPGPSSPPNRSEERWTVALSRANRRRMTTAELVQGYAIGAVTDEALIWKAGMEEWQSPFDIPALALALQARGFARPAVVPSARKEPQGDLPPASASTDAADWDEEAATRVADATISFPGRPSRTAPDGSAIASPPAQTEAVKADPVKVEPHWDEEDDEETTALPQDGASQAKAPEPGAAREKQPVDFDDEATEVIAPDRARELLAAEASKQPTLPPPPAPLHPFDDDEATQVIGEARAEELLAAHATPHANTASPLPEPREARPSGRPSQRIPKAPPAASLPRRQPGTYGAPPIPARRSLQPPRPRGAIATPVAPAPVAEAEPVAPVETAPVAPPADERPPEPKPLDERPPTPKPADERPPTPKPAAGVPPLASLAPPKPSSSPPAGAASPTPPAPEPQNPAEPTVVVAEPKPSRMPVEAALQTMPRLRPPSPPPQAAIRTIQNERTRVVRVVNKGPGIAFWVMLTLALAAAAAGGFVVSQMLRDRGAPAWLRKP